MQSEPSTAHNMLQSAFDNAHAYLAEQASSLSESDYKVVMASQARSLKTKVEQHDEGLTTADAANLLELLRGGPWTGMQVSVISKGLDTAVTRYQRMSIVRGKRDPQSCDNPEVFFSNEMWERMLTTTQPRSRRIAEMANIIISMDLTHPNVACKQRLVAILALGDDWIQASADNAKQCLDELTETLRKARPPLSGATRPHMIDFPKTPADAVMAIEGFAERVYSGDNVPSEDPPYNTADIDTLSRGVAKRWTHKSVRASAPRPGLPAASSGEQQLAVRAPMLLHLNRPPAATDPLQEMQQQHMQMMQCMQATMAGFGQMFERMGCMQGGMPTGGGGGVGGGGGGVGGPSLFSGARSQFRTGLQKHAGRGALLNGGAGDGSTPDGAADEENAAAGEGGTAKRHRKNRDDDDAEYPNEDEAGEEAEAEADELATLETLLTNKAKTAVAPKAKAKAAAKSKTTPNPKPKAKTKSAAKSMAKAAAAPTGVLPIMKKPAAKSSNGTPFWCYEESRQQVLCRTGQRGTGQSLAIKYAVAGSKAAAVKLANAWVAKKKGELGIPA
jgi:hypothetical protein